MVHTPMKLAGLALLGIGLAVGQCANAQSIVQSFTIPTQTTPFSQNFTFNKFDPSLGSLQSIVIDLSVSSSAEVDIFNITGGAIPFTNATASLPLTVSGPGPTTVTATPVAGPFNGTANPGLNAFPGLTGTNTNSTNVLPANFSQYLGGGATGTLAASAGVGNYAGNAASGVFFGGSGNVGGTLKLTYNYALSTTTPEPGSWAMLTACTSTGLALVRRRRRRK